MSSLMPGRHDDMSPPDTSGVTTPSEAPTADELEIVDRVEQAESDLESEPARLAEESTRPVRLGRAGCSAATHGRLTRDR